MAIKLTESDIEKLRELTERTQNPLDSDIASIFSIPATKIRFLMNNFRAQLLDKTISTAALIPTLTNALKSAKKVPPKIEIKQEAATFNAGLPPKMRAKAPMAKTPTAKASGFAQGIPLDNGRSLSAEFKPEPVKMSIPILPRIATSPVSPSKSHVSNPEPVIGSLSVVLHPLLGPAHVCRVLGSKIENNTRHYLVAFFQEGLSPCYVIGDYLYQLCSHVGFPLGDEGEWKESIPKDEVTVDWLLERIYSGAQNLVINHAENLFPQDILARAAVKPDPQQLQQIMFQGVSFAALLLLCYIDGKWEIPQQKLILILDTIMKTNPAKYASTQKTMDEIRETIRKLFTINK